MFGVCLDVTLPIVDHDANFAGTERFTLLHPHDLAIMINRLHAITRHANTKFCAIRYAALRKADHFEVSLVQKRACTSGYRQVADRHIQIADLQHWRYLPILPGCNQILPILFHFSTPLCVQQGAFCIAHKIIKAILQMQRSTDGQKLIVKRKESLVLWMWAVWLGLWAREERRSGTGFNLCQIARNDALDVFFRKRRVFALRIHIPLLPAQSETETVAVVDLVALMLHEQEEVAEIVRVGNRIAQVRFQHGAERWLPFRLAEPFNIADRFGGLSLHNDRQPMLPAELTLFYLIGTIPVVWLALLLAQSLGGGLPELLRNLTSALEQPTNIIWTDKSLPTILICLAAYGMAVLLYRTNQGRTRDGEEHGSAAWATPASVNAQFAQKDSIPLTQHVRLGLDTHKHRRSLNVLVIGGSGAAKTRSFVLPNILTANTNYVITDPKSEVLLATGGYLKEQGYDVRVLNLVNLEQSDGYNPFCYLRDEKDVLKLVNNLIQSTTPKGSHESDPFWTKAETALLQAIILMLFQEAPEYEQNFSMVMRVLEYAEVREEDEGHVSPLDLLFESIERRKPDSVAVRQYKVFKLAAGKTAKSILVSTAVRLAPFNLPQIQALTDHDDMDLYTLGEKKVALYAVIPDNDNTFNFLVSLLYAQAFQALYYSADQIHHGPLPRHVRFVLDEFAAMPLPGFTRELATMRSRSISASVIIQNMAQIKELYKDSWETIPGNCDTILYLGGNESSTHKYVSEMLGKATIDTKTHGQTKGKSGSYSTNFQMSGRELLTPDEVRKLDNRYALLFIRGASPVMDEKYDLMHHPAISHSSLGGAAPYIHHGTKPPIYTGRPLLRVGGTEAIHPLKEEFH